ncbi:hypothetical protein PIB30_053445 [Stylosanthes scabra]|uniref:Late embryogenesis abundant protein LEA-2 subgroup domain-containing protein n=1 Tax=Stylosanthes scabra TaxID=79078 RepID=A0ABU6SJ82_9FABA|nr:hypothetical protein [Stylosanthes scabra]
MRYFVLLRKNNVRDHHSGKDSPSIVLMAELAGLLMFFILSSILVFTCTPSILAELSGKPKPPIVEILGLSVSGLNNVSYKTVSSKWGVELAAKNPNMFSTLYLDHIEGMVLYKNEVLGVTSVENKPIVLGPREHEFVSFKVWRKDWNIDGDQPSVKEWVVANLIREQNKKNKNIKLSVQMGVWGQIKSGWWLRKSVIMNPRCMDLSINVVHDRGFGMLSNKRPIRCYVPMLDH